MHKHLTLFKKIFLMTIALIFPACGPMKSKETVPYFGSNSINLDAEARAFGPLGIQGLTFELGMDGNYYFSIFGSYDNSNVQVGCLDRTTRSVLSDRPEIVYRGTNSTGQIQTNVKIKFDVNMVCGFNVVNQSIGTSPTVPKPISGIHGLTFEVGGDLNKYFSVYGDYDNSQVVGGCLDRASRQILIEKPKVVYKGTNSIGQAQTNLEIQFSTSMVCGFNVINLPIVDVGTGRQQNSLCEFSSDCVGSLFCKDRGDGVSVCVGSGHQNDFCATTGDCVGSLSCKAKNDKVKVCMGNGHEGDYCSSANDCSGTLSCGYHGDGIKVCQSGTQSSQGQQNDFCSTGGDCQGSLFCKDRGDGRKVCVGTGFQNDYCATSGDCEGSLSCKPRGDSINVCMGNGHEGDYCTSSSECVGTLSCRPGLNNTKVCAP